MDVFEYIKKAASITGWILTFVGVVLTIIFAKDGWQRAFLLTLMGAVLIAVFLVILFCEYRKLQIEYKILEDAPPKENNCYADDCYLEGNDWFIITSRSEMYRQDCLVTLYYYNGSIPIRIGFGQLYNYDGVKQYIKIIKEFDSAKPVFEKLKAKDVGYMRNTYVMPIFFKEYIQNL